MVNKKRSLIIILILAVFLRLFKLDNIPPGLNRDEASILYTAHSLLSTGRDEYGKLLPISFQSFGDWKLPLYIYLTVPFVKIFGLNEFAVRLPSAIAGTLAVLLTYFLVEELTGPSLIASFLLAVSPWHLHLSRVGSESNTAISLVLGAILFLLKGFKKPVMLIPGLLLLALTYYTYHGNHIFTTLLIVGLVLIYKKQLIQTKELMIGLGVFIILTVSILSQTLLGADKTKISGISIFGDPTVIHQEIEIPRSIHDSPQSFTAKFFHNRVIYAIETVLQNYLKSFSAEFLFIRGGGNRAHNIANFGNMYLVEAPFLLLGIAALLQLLRRPGIKLILWWIAIAPVAAAITKDAPHTTRMAAILPALVVTTATGIHWTWQWSQKKMRIITAICLIILFALNMVVYLERYYFHFPKTEARFWGNGYKNLATFLSQPDYLHKRVLMSAPETSPYIYLLVYTGFDPKKYQEQAKRYPPTSDNFVHVKNFDRFEFRQIEWSRDLTEPNTVIVEFIDQIPPEYRNRATIIDQFALITNQ